MRRNEAKYSILIPAYNAEEAVRSIIEKIFDFPELPLVPSVGEIIIADDSDSYNDDTKYLASIYSSASLPVKYLPAEKREGPLLRIVAGVELVEYPYLILLNTDVEFLTYPDDYKAFEKLSSSLKERKQIALCPDPLGYLALCLQKEEKLGAISPTILTLEDKSYIHTLSTRYELETLESYSANMLAYFLPIRRSKFSRYQRELALKNRCLAVKTELVKALGFDTAFAPHGRWDEDITFRMRLEDYLIRSTTNAVVLHSLVSQKPEGSLAVLSADQIEEQNKIFREKHIENRDLFRVASLDLPPTAVQPI